MKTPLAQPEFLYPKSRSEWREWLEDNHEKLKSVWVIYDKKGANLDTLTWSEAVDEALCFGWIDGTRRPYNAGQFIQLFAKRKPTSTWSKINKQKIKLLIADKLMKPAGLISIKVAKQNGSWKLLNSVEALRMPEDLKLALKTALLANRYYSRLSRSSKKILLQWLVLARTKKTRVLRISDIVASLSDATLPKPFRQQGRNILEDKISGN